MGQVSNSPFSLEPKLVGGSRSSGGGSISSRSCSVLLLRLRRNREDNRARNRSELNVFRELEVLGIEGHVRFEVGDVQFENRRDACRLSSEHEVTSFLREDTTLSLNTNRETGELDRDTNLHEFVISDLDEVNVSDLLGDGVLLDTVDDSRIASLAVDFEVKKRVTLARSKNLAEVDFAYSNVLSFDTLTL